MKERTNAKQWEEPNATEKKEMGTCTTLSRLGKVMSSTGSSNVKLGCAARSLRNKSSDHVDCERDLLEAVYISELEIIWQ